MNDKTSTLTDADFKKYWLRLYFDTSQGNLIAAIRRAYRDFARTLRYSNKGLISDLKDKWITLLEKQIYIVLKDELNQKEFDEWHETTCNLLSQANSNHKLEVGKTQKWVNMTLKYLVLMDEDGVNKNYSFFHIPIDSIIQEELFKEYKLPVIPNAWSKITSYPEYFKYQNDVRNILGDKIPLDEEFKLFNKSTIR